MWGREYTVTEVLDRVLRDRPFFEKSGGGVTISGGEPFSQAGFTLALLRAFKAQGLHTAVDTTGCAPWEVVEKALPYIDLFLYDLKSLDAVAHKAATGVGNAPILDNARRIAVAGGKMQVRLPVVPRFNESEEHIRAAAEFIQELGDAVTTVQVLPYHAMGVPKLERIRHRGPILEATLLTDAQVERIKAILEEYGLLVQVH
jgi:pyruvate formate lyase activating enzyme